MHVELIYSRSDWNAVLNACRTTMAMEDTENEPKKRWKYNILLAEHSPIRLLQMTVKVYDVKYWVVGHLVRHHIGIEKFVVSQRDDRTGKDRDNLPQSALVDIELDMNAQALINISRKRLCHQAHRETREVWKAILEAVRKEFPELVDVCVPECIYRNFCPELKTCGFSKSDNFYRELVRYHQRLKADPIDVDTIFGHIDEWLI